MVKLNFILKRLILLSLLSLLFSCGGGSSGGSAPLAQFPEQLAISEQINNIAWDISNLDSFCNNNQQCDPVVTDIQLLDSENSVIPTSTKDEIRTTFQTKLSILVEEIASSDVNLQLSNDEQISTFTECIIQMKDITNEFNVPEANSILTQFQDTQIPVSAPSATTPSDSSNSTLDCHGIENGTGILDDCGICDGPGITTWYQDSDEDGLGNPLSFTQHCIQPNNYVLDNTDTDDDAAAEQAAAEQAEADRLAAEEADRLAAEEATRLAAEEADRIAAEEAARLAAEQAEADRCPSDPLKTEPGVCGCGIQDIDNNQDTIVSYQDCHQSPVFNGTNSRIIVTPSDTSFEMQTLTLEAWIELPELNRNHKNTIISYGYGTELQASQGEVDRQTEESFALTYRSSTSEHRIRFRLKGNNGTRVAATIIDLLYVVPEEQRPYGKPLHIAVTWDGSTATLYLNGEQSSTLESSTSKQIYYENIDVSKLYIGNWFGNNERYFKGLISDVRIWNTVRTRDEVNNNYRNALDETELGLIGYFPLNGLNFENTSSNSTTTSLPEKITSSAHTTD